MCADQGRTTIGLIDGASATAQHRSTRHAVEAAAGRSGRGAHSIGTDVASVRNSIAGRTTDPRRGYVAGRPTWVMCRRPRWVIVLASHVGHVPASHVGHGAGVPRGSWGRRPTWVMVGGESIGKHHDGARRCSMWRRPYGAGAGCDGSGAGCGAGDGVGVGAGTGEGAPADGGACPVSVT